MPLRPHLRAYLCSFTYAAALLFTPFFGPRLFGATLLQLAIVASLLVLLVLLLSHRDEVVELVLAFFHACVNVVLCLLQAFTPEWLPVSAEATPADPLHAVLFQRPPPPSHSS